MKPELFFGLVAAVGTDSDRVCEALSQALQAVGYRPRILHLTDALRELPPFKALPQTPLDEYYRRHMEAGDSLCERTGMRDAMASLGVVMARDERSKENGGDEEKPLDSTAYVFRSLKRPDEVRFLRGLYGDRFNLIAAYSPREKRVSDLAARIASSRSAPRADAFRSEAESLVQIDEAEGIDSGQDVQRTFPLADVFVDASPQTLPRTMNRFIELLFGNGFRTPSIDEYGMFLAHGAARRSADLSRQVGAAVLSASGSVLALGTNEVPKAGGGVYWEDDDPDSRDFQLGFDWSYRRRAQLLGDVLQRLGQMNWLASTIARRRIDSLVSEALEGDSKVLRDAQLMDVIEFGRSVHAEMLAITDAASRGVSLEGATLYSTTFPCHNCARHIVSAGISRVVYIEPYPKSLAHQLFEDSIVVDSSVRESGRVNFVPYIGIGPRVYLDLFSSGVRKTSGGDAINWSPLTSTPRVAQEGGTYAPAERIAASNLFVALRTARIVRRGTP